MNKPSIAAPSPGQPGRKRPGRADGGDPANVPRILVVDDSPAIHEDFRKALQSGPDGPLALEKAEAELFGGNPSLPAAPRFAIDYATQGHEALAMVRKARAEQRPYAVAFIDMRMPPGWDGVETTIQIWAQDAEVQVVICTAFSDYSWTQTLAALGTSDRLVILKKPFDIIEVQQLAKSLSEKWRLARQSLAALHSLEQRIDERTRELRIAGEQLRSSEAQYRLLFDSNPNPMWVVDTRSQRFLAVNKAAVDHYRYTDQQFRGMAVGQIGAGGPTPEDAGHGTAGHRLQRHRRGDGSPIDVEVMSERIVFDGHPAELVLVHDVTARKRVEDALQRMNRVYAVLSQINLLTVRVREREPLFEATCQIAVEHGGFRLALIATLDPETRTPVPVAIASPNAALRQGAARLVGAPEEGLSSLIADAARTGGPMVCNDWRRIAGGGRALEPADTALRSIAVLPLTVANDTVAVLVLCAAEPSFFQDDELKLLTQLANEVSFAMDHLQKAERLQYLAFHDPLTGLANRTLFVQRMTQQMLRANAAHQNLAIYLLDLERFKHVNDGLGRQAGDALLKQVATWLSRRCGNPGLVASVGADHFAILTPSATSEDDALQAVEIELDALAQQPFRLEGAIVRVSAKAGVALYPENGRDAETLLQNAEAALKRAKVSGERCLQFRDQMTDTVATRLTLETRLCQAIENREFVVHYQPKLDLHSGRICGAEALIRWNDPRSGLVSPAQFIPILEETGLIREVGRWVLRQAIADQLRWRRAGLPAVSVAVNVSPLQLRSPGLLPELWQALAVDPESAAGLELEITESVIMEDVQQSIACLQAIREMGVKVAIDDFGTGFSSLSYLSRLPVDTVKIDRTFIVDMMDGPQGLALVSAVINVAHAFKLNVVAEGVETAEQSRLLRLLNCDQIQGFHISAGIPSATFEERFLRPLA